MGIVFFVVVVVRLFFSLPWPHENRPRSSQMDFLLQSMLMAQYLFKYLCLILHCVPHVYLLLKNGNVIVIVIDLFYMLYNACNIGLRWAGCKSTKTPHLLNCSFYLLVGRLSLQWKIGWSHVEAVAQSH